MAVIMSAGGRRRSSIIDDPSPLALNMTSSPTSHRRNAAADILAGLSDEALIRIQELYEARHLHRYEERLHGAGDEGEVPQHNGNHGNSNHNNHNDDDDDDRRSRSGNLRGNHLIRQGTRMGRRNALHHIYDGITPEGFDPNRRTINNHFVR